MNDLKTKLRRKFSNKTWRFWELLGFHLIPNHFYYPVMDSKHLNNYDFARTFPLNGLNLDDSSMMNTLDILSEYTDEYGKIHQDSGYSSNGDGAILYGMIRKLKPTKIIEVGSGFSTRIINYALIKNAHESNVHGTVTSIEPFPKPVLLHLAKSSEHVTLIKEKIQNVDIDIIQNLQAGDLFFIDTSHVLDVGNDVHHLYLHLLPRLPVGVYVHIHDIRFPHEYPKDWVVNAHKHWTEQYLLHMFLAFNESFEIVFASNYIYEKFKHKMVDSLYDLRETDDGWPGSFWIRRVK